MLITPEELKQNVKLFKNGNSYAFRVSKKDIEILNIDENTEFEKIVSPDGSKITFRKIIKARSNVLDVSDNLMDKHSELMHRLDSL